VAFARLRESYAGASGAMMEQKYKYQINGKTYVLKKMVLGQMRQLIEVLKTIRISEGMGTAGLIAALGDKLPIALAIVLTEEGKPIKDKNLKEMAEEIEFNIDLDLAVQVIDDFFALNPIASLWEKIQGLLEGIGKKMTKTDSTNSSSPSAVGTSPKEMPLSGDLPSTNASLS
jgi:hypothetical protein